MPRHRPAQVQSAEPLPSRCTDASSSIMAKFGSKRTRTKQQLEEHAAECKRSRTGSRKLLQNGAACFCQPPQSTLYA